MDSINISGLDGRSIKDIWSSHATAYKGVSVTSLPNFGMLYGPNTNLSHNSLILVIEAQARYIAAQVREVELAAAKGKSLVITPNTAKVQEYSDSIQARLQKTSFADERCGCWWKDKDGWIPNNWDGTAVEYQTMMSKIEWRDYDLEGEGAEQLRRKGVTDIGRVVEEAWIEPVTKVILEVLGVAGAAAAVASLYMGRTRLVRS